jgi:hypothetical protein
MRTGEGPLKTGGRKMADHKGKEPHVLYCDAHKGNSSVYVENHERTFGKKPLPHGKKKEIITHWQQDLGIETIKSVLSYEVYGKEGEEAREVPNRTYAFTLTREVLDELGGRDALRPILKRIEQRALLSFLTGIDHDYEWEVFHKPENCYPQDASLEELEGLRDELDNEMPKALGCIGKVIFQQRIPWEISYDFETARLQLYSRFAYTGLEEGEKWWPTGSMNWAERAEYRPQTATTKGLGEGLDGLAHLQAHVLACLRADTT